MRWQTHAGYTRIHKRRRKGRCPFREATPPCRPCGISQTARSATSSLEPLTWSEGAMSVQAEGASPSGADEARKRFEELRGSVDAAVGLVRGFTLTYLLAGAYIAIATGAVDHH